MNGVGGTTGIARSGTGSPSGELGGRLYSKRYGSFHNLGKNVANEFNRNPVPEKLKLKKA